MGFVVFDEATVERLERRVPVEGGRQSGGVVLVAADGVLPEAALPDIAFSIGLVHAQQSLCLQQAAGEKGIDQPPAGRQILLARELRRDGVEVIEEDHPGFAREWLAAAADRIAQEIDAGDQQRVAASVTHVDGEEQQARVGSRAASSAQPIHRNQHRAVPPSQPPDD